MMIETGQVMPIDDARAMIVDGMSSVGGAMDNIDGRLARLPFNVAPSVARDVQAWVDDLRRKYVERARLEFREEGEDGTGEDSE